MGGTGGREDGTARAQRPERERVVPSCSGHARHARSGGSVARTLREVPREMGRSKKERGTSPCDADASACLRQIGPQQRIGRHAVEFDFGIRDCPDFRLAPGEVWRRDHARRADDPHAALAAQVKLARIIDRQVLEVVEPERRRAGGPPTSPVSFSKVRRRRRACPTCPACRRPRSRNRLHGRCRWNRRRPTLAEPGEAVCCCCPFIHCAIVGEFSCRQFPL